MSMFLIWRGGVGRLRRGMRELSRTYWEDEAYRSEKTKWYKMYRA
jgi:hypothetical protein